MKNFEQLSTDGFTLSQRQLARSPWKLINGSAAVAARFLRLIEPCISQSHLGQKVNKKPMKNFERFSTDGFTLSQRELARSPWKLINGLAAVAARVFRFIW